MIASSRSIEKLFEPQKIGKVELSNRIVMPPMGFHTAFDGVPGPDVAEYYRLRAEGGAGLILPDFPIAIRISQWKLHDYGAKVATDPRELEDWVLPLVDAGVDVFDCSQRRFWEPEFAGSDLNLAGWVKKVSGKPTITVGSVGLNRDMVESLGSAQDAAPVSLDRLMERLERDEFDLVAVGRALIADPYWPAKVKAGHVDKLVPFNVSVMAASPSHADLAG